MDVTGKFILVSKHLATTNGKKKRRRYFSESEIDGQVELAQSYAIAKDEDFLIVQIVKEIQNPKNKEKSNE